MPPEQLPWDRRDFRKHERSGSDARFGGGGLGGSGPNRWREQQHHPHQPPPPPPHGPPYHHHNNHHQQQRWYSDFRSSRPIPPGHGKQGGWHMYPDDAGHGFLPFGSRYGDRNIDDDNHRPFASRGDGRFFRNSRENRGSFSQKEWRSPSLEPAASPNGPGRPISEVNNQKSPENAEACNKDNNKNDDQSNSCLKEKHEKNGGTSGGVARSGQKSDKENGLGSIDWNCLKWTRSKKNVTTENMAVDSTEIVAEVQQQKNVTPVQSPAAACVVPTTLASSDENSSRKKARLGWGEGLAKYEKKKVEGPEDGATKDGLVVDVSNSEIMTVNLLDKSPRVASLSDCISPATPSSVSFSSSPGVEEKDSFKAANFDQESGNLSCSPNIMSHAHYEGPTLNLENLDLTSIANLSAFINELLQAEDASSVETGYVRSTSLNKLLVWKVDMLKALEMTESEIDSLETKLRLLIAEPRSNSCPLKPCEGQVTASSFTVEHAPLQAVSGVKVILENRPAALKDDGIDSPGSATSKLVDNRPPAEVTFPSETAVNVEGFVNLNSNNSCGLGSGPSNEDNICCGDDCKPNATDCQNIATVGNKDISNTALEELNKLLPAQQCLFDISSASSLQSDSSLIKERFLMRKRSLHFKEKILALKFKAFQHFWKEGRVVSIRKLRGKSHKKFDLSRTGYKKNRSSSRSRNSYFAGSLRTVPAEEVFEFVNGLLLELALRPCRNTLKMPALILDKATKMSRFISNNGLVEDPCGAEKERCTINPWTAEEREIFIDKLALFGKDFKKIESFLEHKTIADCIEFYYKNHKSECFARARKKPDFAKQKNSQSTTYLVGTGKRWNREANAASLDILGEASVIAANANDGLQAQHKSSPSRIFFGASSSHKSSNTLDLYSNETVAADVLAGICGSLSSEAMSSCITSSVDPADGYHQDWKSQRVNSCIKRPLTPDVTQNVDDECSDESCGEMTDPADWTDEEKSIFIQAVSSYGKDFVMISRCVRTRSRDQCKIFFSKAKKCLALDLIQPGAENGVNGGGSDVEDACLVEAGSGICNDSSKREMKLSHESDMLDLKPDVNICGENSGPCQLDSMAAESVLKNSSTDDNHVDDKPVIDFNVSSNEQNGDADTVSVEFSNRHNSEQNEDQGHVLTEDNLDDKKVECRNADFSEKLNVSHLSVDSQSSTQVESVCQFPSVESSTLFSVPIKYQRHSTNNAHTNGCANLISDKNSQKIIRVCDRKQNLLSYPLSDPVPVESSDILRGYPISVQTSKGINGDHVNCKKDALPLHNIPKNDGKLHLGRDFSLQKCTDSCGPQSSRSSDADKPSGNGDVKLFGKILVSSQQKPNTCKQGNADDNVSGDHKVNLDSSKSKLCCNNYIGSESTPMRNFGFWDGKMMNTGFSPLPPVPLNGVSVFPRNQELHMKQPQDVVLFSEMQRRNGFGVNVGVSDPVTAIKMQYKAQNFNLQAGNVIREDDTWSNEDVGR